MSDRSIVEMLRAIKAREWVSEDDVTYLGTLVRWVTATSDGPCVGGKGLVLNESGKEVLALADECERWRLRSVWKEKRARRSYLEYERDTCTGDEEACAKAVVEEDAARAACLTAGGVE